MSKFVSEFKEFIAQGNAMDMAVGIIIGGAFTAIVTSLVEDIINPFITLITGGNGTEVGALNVMGIDFGAFISAIINFLIIAFVVFLLIKGLNGMKEAGAKLSGKTKEEEAPTTKECPFCKSEIAIEATRCPHCTSEL